MKKIRFSLAIIIFIILFTACSYQKDEGLISPGDTADINDFTDIIIKSPMTLSNNDLYNLTGENHFLRLKMVKGKYYEDWNPGAYMGTLWEGFFIVDLVDEFDNIIARTDLSEIYNYPLIFNSSFTIEFDDYNNDGNLDFTIGQYSSSNGRHYMLFTLGEEGHIEKLPIEGYDSLFISNTTGFYSTKLNKLDAVTFEIEYYDNPKGKSIVEVFRWDGNEFISIEGSNP